MRHLQKASLTVLFLAFLGLSFSLAGCGANSAPDSANSADPSAKKAAADKPGMLGGMFASTKSVTIPADTPVQIVLDQSISSADSHAGDEFDASVAQPIVIDGKTVIPKNARAKGRVVDAQASGRLKGVARLELALASIEINGKTYDVNTGDTTLTGSNHNKRNAVLMGGGTGVGALIGGLAGGGKGALIGAAVGAGAGTAGAAATGKKDIRLPAESRLTFRLTQPLTVQVKS